jgi:hypothetical protein
VDIVEKDYPCLTVVLGGMRLPYGLANAVLEVEGVFTGETMISL